MSHSQEIGSFIRSRRESKGFSQDYMAAMLNIAQSAYANLEAGKTSMSIDRLIRITEILDFDIHSLFNRSLAHNVHPFTLQDSPLNGTLYPDTKEAYDMLIFELRNEIGFLRSLLKKE